MVDVPEEVGDGAIRMVAFGVLEHNPPAATMLFEDDFEQQNITLEVEQLVINEINARGWKLSAIALKQGREFILLGKLGGTVALPTRPKIGQGTLQEVCKAAVDWLDNGPQPSPVLERDEDRYLKR